MLATHADWDHVCGIAAFPEAVAAMGERTAAIVQGGAPAELIERRAEEHAIAVAGPPRVNSAFEVGTAQRLGRIIVETFALAGHTPDGAAFRVRALDLLAVGDHLSLAPGLKFTVPLTGLEPVLSALRGRRVNHLHHSGKLYA